MGQSNMQGCTRDELLDDDGEEDGVEGEQSDGGCPGGAHVSKRRLEDEHVDNTGVHNTAAERGLQDFVVEALRLKELAHDLEDAVEGERDRKHAHVTDERRVLVREKW